MQRPPAVDTTQLAPMPMFGDRYNRVADRGERSMARYSASALGVGITFA